MRKTVRVNLPVQILFTTTKAVTSRLKTKASPESFIPVDKNGESVGLI